MNQSISIAQPHFDRLFRHLFPGDHDEHGAVILAGVAESGRGTRFLARDVVLARDGIDYVPGTRGYRALTTDFIVRVSDRCVRENLCYFAVHCHGGRDQVAFSPDDFASHKRGYPALLDILDGGPVGALVFAENAVAGEVWRPSGVTQLDQLTIIGPNLRHLFPHPRQMTKASNQTYARQSLLFGETGQVALANAKVGIIGLGGVGSLVSQSLAHLGVGHIVGVDFDVLEPSNRPRVVGTRPRDAGEPFIHSKFSAIRWLGEKLAKHKAAIAARVARRANCRIKYDAIVGNIVDMRTAMLLADADYLFLCADSMQARLVFNALVHQYLIPGVQIGSKVPVNPKTGKVEDVFVVSRPVLPYAGGGCLTCNQLIPAAQLHKESLSPEERQQQAYVTDAAVTVPSVITLNALAAGQAVNDFLFGFHGLVEPDATAGYLLHYPRERSWVSMACASDNDCRHCGVAKASRYARGDRAELPCREKQ
jgi:tRNA A37 threonylcarbamoyladenosine dehydratase